MAKRGTTGSLPGRLSTLVSFTWLAGRVGGVSGGHSLHRSLPTAVDRNCSETGRAISGSRSFEFEIETMDAVLPGEDLIEAGLQDLREGRETIAALLVAIGAPRLKRLGVELP